MQTCSLCYHQSPDTAQQCVECQADLMTSSISAITLQRFTANPRVKNIRLVSAHDCCPACAATTQTFDKDEAPRLPIDGCSHSLGCRCFYEPMLTDIYP